MSLAASASMAATLPRRSGAIWYACAMPRRLLSTVPAAVALLVAAAAAPASTSHEGWPKIDGDLKMHRADENGEIRATKVDKHNELLGGHGNDTIVGGNVGDV